MLPLGAHVRQLPGQHLKGRACVHYEHACGQNAVVQMLLLVVPTIRCQRQHDVCYMPSSKVASLFTSSS